MTKYYSYYTQKKLKEIKQDKEHRIYDKVLIWFRMYTVIGITSIRINAVTKLTKVYLMTKKETIKYFKGRSAQKYFEQVLSHIAFI